MNFIRQIAFIAGISSATCFILLFCHEPFGAARVSSSLPEQGQDETTGHISAGFRDAGPSPAEYIPRTGRSGPATPSDDFFHAAGFAVSATVHITIRNNGTGSPAGPARPEKASGSGALISQDGYIVTNNHVVEGAGEIKVTLSNKRSFPARLVGSDAGNDLALIKIDAQGLPFLLFGNSDELKPGQWVLATGYPLDLEATVTAGIISTKKMSPAPDASPKGTGHQNPGPGGRIGIRSFIQTDAAINHGNSGGPLVNVSGQLVGIDSYFASPTGAYTGYSFAIPVNTVKKVVYNLMK